MHNLSFCSGSALKTQINGQKSNVMASFEVVGYINQTVYKQDCVMLFVDEFRRGYKKSDGTMLEDRYVTYKIIYKPYFKKYIATNFSKGMLVKVKGEVYPYAIEHGKPVEGLSFLGETCNLFSYPKANVKQEIKMIKDSLENSTEQPDLDAYNQPDFIT